MRVVRWKKQFRPFRADEVVAVWGWARAAREAGMSYRGIAAVKWAFLGKLGSASCLRR